MSTSSISLRIPASLSQRARLWRYLPVVIIATSSVIALPLVALRGIERIIGDMSLVPSLLIGAVLSVVISFVGARMWSSLAASQDILFGELMVWGWIRRMRNEKRLENATRLLGLKGAGWAPDSSLSPQQQAQVLQRLTAALETRDPYTHGHTSRVTRYSYAIARQMNLGAEMVENVRVAASMHDVGKVDVPLEVLRKTGSLTDEEFDLMKAHAARSGEMVAPLGNSDITAMVRHHHERLDGRGYPDKLQGHEIPLGARIIAVADTFDAICSTRSYRKASNHRKALEIIKKEAGTQLDHDAVDAFVIYYSGHGAVEWRASITTIPQRLLGVLGNSVQHASPAALLQGVAAVTAAVAIANAPIARITQETVSMPDFVTRASELPSLRELSSLVTSGEPGSVGARDDDGLLTDARPIALGPGAIDDPSANTPSAGSDNDGAGGSRHDGNGGSGSGAGTVGDTGENPAGDADETSEDGSVTDPVKETTDTVGDTVDGTTDTVGDTVDGTTDTVGDTVDDTTDTVGDTVDDTTDTVGDTVDVIDGTVDTTTDVIDGTVDTTTDVIDGLTGDTTGGLTDTVDSTTGDLTETTDTVTDTTTDLVTDTTDTVTDTTDTTVTDTTDTVTDTTDTTVTDTTDTVTDTTDTVTDTVTDPLGGL